MGSTDPLPSFNGTIHFSALELYEVFIYILFLLSGDLPYPGVKPGSPEFQADSLPSEPPGKFPYFFLDISPLSDI